MHLHGLGSEVGCCLKKEKHDRCMQCKSMDCSHNTCTVNKKYYSERKMEEDTTVRRALAAPPLSKTTFNDVRSDISYLKQEFV